MQADNTLYLRQETRMLVDERKDPKEVFDTKYFAYAAERLNSIPFTKFMDTTSATKTLPYDSDHLIYKVSITKETADSSKIRISDIQGLYYSTTNGEIKYVENPEKQNT